MNRVPIRARLSIGFALVMVLLLTVVGLFVYRQMERGLDKTIDRELAARLAGAVAIVRDDGDDLGDPMRDPLVRIDPGGYVQVLDPDGHVVSATSSVLADDPLTGVVAASGNAGEAPGVVRARDVDVPGLGTRLRVAAAGARDDGVDYTVVAGASLQQRDETLAELRNLLWLEGPILLLLTTLAGYLLAASALRPVERMRERAAELSGEDIGDLLPVPPANDEISRLGETLNAMLGRVALALDRERSFVADASHELRTPLTILRAELDLAGRPGRSPEETRRAIASSLEETDRLIALASDLLLLSQADAGALAPATQRVPAGEFIGAVVERLASLAREKEIEISVAPTSVMLEIDPERLGQALYNLVANALAHANSRIEIDVLQEDDWTMLRVRDDGPGFRPKLLRSGLERFSRGRDGGDGPGTGLGLAIAEAITKSHGGEVRIANRPDGGADARIVLPDND